MHGGDNTYHPLTSKRNQDSTPRGQHDAVRQSVREDRIDRHGNCNIAKFRHGQENGGQTCILAFGKVCLANLCPPLLYVDLRSP